MKIKEIKRAEEIDNEEIYKLCSFLQSWQWGEIQKKEGMKILRLGGEENGELIIISTFIRKKIGLGKEYLYCPHGPVINNAMQEEKEIEVMVRFFRELQKECKNKIIFLRLEPQLKIEELKKYFKIQKTIDIQPSKTIFLDLRKTEEELLATMHYKTRYNIKLAEKKGVIIKEGSLNDFEAFWKLMEQTVARDSFRLHKKNHYKNLLKNGDGLIKLFLAEYNDEIVAANLLSFYGDVVTYVHGASGNKHRNIMAPYALQWHSIKNAKKNGFKYYDFYGIDEKKWPGVTRFKKGFGGETINYLGTYDFVFNLAWYNAYKMVRNIKRKI